MKHLRQNGFSHRDIKPGNILVCIADDGRYDTKSKIWLSDVFDGDVRIRYGDFHVIFLQTVMSTNCLTSGQLNLSRMEISSSL